MSASSDADAARPRHLIVLLAVVVALLLTGCGAVTGSAVRGLGAQGRAAAFTPSLARTAASLTDSGAARRPAEYSYDSAVALTTSGATLSIAERRDQNNSAYRLPSRPAAAIRSIAARGVGDATVIVRGGQSELPAAGEVFSGA